MSQVGWVWEGHGLDPGVHPSIFGVGEGATFFGLRKARFLFHPTTELALQKLSPLDEVVCDISKWLFKDTEGGGSACYGDASGETICAEAGKVSRFSRSFPNVTGAFFDDMRGLMEREKHNATICEAIQMALKADNPDLTLWCVVYSHELDDTAFWASVSPFIDAVSFWVWSYKDLGQLARHVDQCRQVFSDKPISMGCYLRDYGSRQPVPMDALRQQWQFVSEALDDNRIDCFEILGTVLIDGQLEQATWVRDFIRDHS
jgi:hypothetical protein